MRSVLSFLLRKLDTETDGKNLRMQHVFTQFLLMLMTKRILLVNQKCDVK